MKYLSIFLTGLRLAAAVAIPPDNIVNSAEPRDDASEMEPSGVFDSSYGKPDNGKSIQGGVVSQGVFLEPSLDRSKPATPDGKVTTLRYGPYRVGAMSAVEDMPAFNLQKPCSNCYIVAMQANLVYQDGKEANVNEGGWLHHMILYNINGFTRRDDVCSFMPRRIFAAGNERNAVRTNGKYKYGIELNYMDTLGMLYELMNDSNQAQTYVIEMTYEWVPMTTSGYKPIRMAWLDIGGCGPSDYPAQAGEFEIKSSGWTAPYRGRLLSAKGHTHDGGDEVTVYKNGQPVCKSPQIYGGEPGWVDSMKIAHISNTGSCVDFGDLEPGDTLVVGARYNTSAHPLSKAMHGAGNAPIMGISQVYIG